jgi:AcrR family transcriptional regulator
MPPTDRQAKEQAAVKEKILASARALFVEHGVEAVSLRKIAESIGYTAPALYTHFSDKAEILKELCRRDFDALAQVFVRLAEIPDPVERIYRVGMTYIRFAKDWPNHYRLMFMTPNLARIAPPDAADLEAMNDPDQDAYAFLKRAVAEALAAGRFRDELKDVELLTQTLWAGVHGVASLEITHAECPWVNLRAHEKRAKTMCAAVLRGLLKDPESLEVAS